jgi:hypothetical protein
LPDGLDFAFLLKWLTELKNTSDRCERAKLRLAKVSPERGGKVAEKVSWLDKIAWKSNIASFLAGMLVLTFGFGYMSRGTHEALAKEHTDSAIRPYVASSCAAQFRQLPDYETRKATLAAKAEDAYATRQAIPEQLVALPGQRWADDRIAAECAKLILDRSPAKAAELRLN